MKQGCIFDIHPRLVSRDLQILGVPTFGKQILPLTSSRSAVPCGAYCLLMFVLLLT